jgi:PAS domain S-box-containing protein
MWDFRLEVFSLAVAILGSYLGLDFAGRMKTSPRKIFWFLAGAVTMGLAIWAMHFISLLAVMLSSQISVDGRLSTLSALTAMTGAGITFSILNRSRLSWIHMLCGSVAMGLAIVSMHYIGMESMRIPVRIDYDPFLFMVSVLTAIVASGAALWLTFQQEPDAGRGQTGRRIGAAILMGAAIWGMHNFGMQAASYQHVEGFSYGFLTNPTVGSYLLSDLLIFFGVVVGIMLLLLNSYSTWELKKTLDELAESENRFSNIFHQALVGILKTDPTGKAQVVNSRLQDLFNVPSESIGNLYFQDLVHPDDLELALECMNHALKTHEPVIFEHRCLDFKGGIKCSSSRIMPAREKPGLTDLHIIMVDITELKQAEKALEESKERFRLLVEEVKNYAIYWIDLKGNVESWNKGAERIFGYSTEEILGQHFSIFFTDDVQETSSVLLYRAEREKRLEMEMRQKRKNNVVFDALITLTPARNEQGELVGFSNITRDITDEKRWRQDLLESHRMLEVSVKKLEQSNRELEQFATIASHDLQAPLRKVMIYSDAIQAGLKDAIPKEAQDYLLRMQRATCNMQNLITDLLALSRVNRKGQPFRRISLSDVMVEVFLHLEEKIQQTGAHIEVDGMISLDADPVQLRQLLQNLLENALKFHFEGQKPFVYINSYIREDGQCDIVVQDNGIGFDEKYLDRIFAVFERLHPETRFQGTGMGLAICKKIAERHSGQITAKSQPNHGSTFIVTLPVNQPEVLPKYPVTAKDQVQ